MYEFDKLDGETIKLITDEVYITIDDEKKLVSGIVTNKRLILLDYLEGYNNYEEAMRTGLNLGMVKKKYPILLIDNKDIKEVKETKYYDKYILNNGSYFNIESKDIKKHYIDKIKEA